MKKAEEYTNNSLDTEIDEGMTFLVNTRLYEIHQLIEQAQKDAYNQAIDDAIKNAKVSGGGARKSSEGYLVSSPMYLDKQSILKLKK